MIILFIVIIIEKEKRKRSIKSMKYYRKKHRTQKIPVFLKIFNNGELAATGGIL